MTTPLDRMRAKEALLTADDVRALLSYDPVSGIFTWLAAGSHGGHNGYAAGSQKDGSKQRGYALITINGVLYQAARVAWLIMTGEWPQELVDHRDGDRSNNIWDNLRAATRAQNNRNLCMRRDNTTGFKGVERTRGGRYKAAIKFDGRRIRLGTFDTPEEASAVYQAAADRLHGEFARRE